MTTFAFTGSYAQMRVVPVAATFLVSEGLDMGVALAIPCGPGKAALALQLSRLAPGETVLVTAAAQLAAKPGARVLGAARHREVMGCFMDAVMVDATLIEGLLQASAEG